MMQRVRMTSREIELTHERVAAVVESFPVELRELQGGMVIKPEGQMLLARLDYLTPERVFLWFQMRTTSWDFQGERTDLHDVLSLVLAALFSVTGTASCRLIDEVNPAGIPGLEDEIYARLLVPEQPGSVVQLDPPESMRRLLLNAWSLEATMWEHLHLPEDCPCEKSQERRVLSVEALWEEKVLRALRQQRSDRIFASGSVWPEWEYFRSPRSGISVVWSPSLAGLLAIADAREAREAQLTEEGQFIRAGELGNLVPPPTLQRARRVLGQLRDLDEGEEPHLFPLEDRLVASGRRHLIALPAVCGRDAFRVGSEQVQHRAQSELTFFGVDRCFEWADKIEADRFEELVGDLLERAGQVAWIRQVGATRERDRGRDFVAEWVTTTPADALPEGSSPQVRVQVIIQCKSIARAVNAGDVPSIVDTIEEHQAQGYFLAVSSRLSAPLVDRLLALRQRKRFDVVDWWGRREIERELRKAPDILARYSDLVWPVHPETDSTCLKPPRQA